jgi:hypothetical protein
MASDTRGLPAGTAISTPALCRFHWQGLHWPRLFLRQGGVLLGYLVYRRYDGVDLPSPTDCLCGGCNRVHMLVHGDDVALDRLQGFPCLAYELHSILILDGRVADQIFDLLGGLRRASRQVRVLPALRWQSLVPPPGPQKVEGPAHLPYFRYARPPHTRPSSR